MDPRRLSLILLAGGAAVTLLALLWFATAFAEAMDSASRFAGDDYALSLIACLYSSPAVCQGVALFSESPAYSPVVFWIGVVALLAGIVIRFAAGPRTAGRAPAAGTPGAADQAPESAELLGLIPPAQYTRYSYMLGLCGAVAGLLFTPLLIVAVAALVLGLLGLTAFRDRLNTLDVRHLGVLCTILLAAGLTLFVTRGTFLFLLAALAQIALIYVGFNSYRHGRTVTMHNLKNETLMALKPGTVPFADHERQ
jgi:hypothetical protein